MVVEWFEQERARWGHSGPNLGFPCQLLSHPLHVCMNIIPCTKTVHRDWFRTDCRDPDPTSTACKHHLQHGPPIESMHRDDGLSI